MTMANGEQLGRREVLALLGLGAGWASVWREEIGWTGAVGYAGALNAQPSRIPSGAIVRTVLKDVSPDALGTGAALIHEHLVGGFYSSPPRSPASAAGAATPTQQGRGGQQASSTTREDTPEALDLIVEELQASKKDGLSAIVDASTGRRSPQAIENLKSIAMRSGVHVIVGGGYYRAPYPPEIIEKTEDQIADQFYQDAQTQRWGAFGEIGSSMETHPDERKMMRAVSKAHVRTGLPIFTHSPHESCQKCALEQLDIYEAQGVSPRHLCIGHLSDLRDDPRADTPIAIAKRGAFVGFDTVGHELNVSRSTLVTDRMKLRMVLAVLEAGYENSILFSSDMAHNNHLKANWGDGFSAVLVTFRAKLMFAGVKEATIRKILHDNPRRFLAFVPKK